MLVPVCVLVSRLFCVVCMSVKTGCLHFSFLHFPFVSCYFICLEEFLLVFLLSNLTISLNQYHFFVVFLSNLHFSLASSIFFFFLFLSVCLFCSFIIYFIFCLLSFFLFPQLTFPSSRVFTTFLSPLLRSFVSFTECIFFSLSHFLSVL